MARQPETIEARLLHLMSERRYQPLAKTELAKKLNVPVDQRAAFRKLLQRLEAEGRIARIRKERYVLPGDVDLFTGVLQVNPQGFGYILNETGDGLGDLYVSADNMGTAMHGDRVVARIIRDDSR